MARRHLEPHEWVAAFMKLCEVRGVQLGKGGDRKSTETVSVDAAKGVAEELGVDERTAQNRSGVSAVASVPRSHGHWIGRRQV